MKLQITPYLAIELTEPNELIELISDEDKVDFMQSLACDDIVIKHVTDQLLHGCTEDGYHGSFGGNRSEPSTPLDTAKRAIAKSYSKFVSDEITSLERGLKRSNESKDEYMSKYYDLLHKRPL
tara:strand:- start:5873 stop:6241 length:369 start_codon:yes stop_codon:yes gene_type:complete